MKKPDFKKIIQSLADYYGELSPPLNFRNNYELCISVVLSAQTTDAQVNRVTPYLFEKYPSFEKLASADINDVERIIKSTGFYKVKARSIIALSKRVSEEFNGQLPSSMEKLILLPGVGRKSANVVLSHGFDIPAIAVDTHVARLSVRLGFSVYSDVKKIEADLMKKIPRRLWSSSHLYLITHGRTFCKARKPLCKNCPIRLLCPYKDKCL
ncbi:MAG TPA: endonuclease III [Spirochaetota bacterium]|nr:endonuclease III [Spirochaetota bacterium]